jgi:hypothetical protein
MTDLTGLPLAAKKSSILIWPGPWWNVTAKLQSSPAGMTKVPSRSTIVVRFGQRSRRRGNHERDAKTQRCYSHRSGDAVHCASFSA